MICELASARRLDQRSSAAWKIWRGQHQPECGPPKLVITNSAFVLNHAGVVPNSRNNDGAPPPHDRRCPGSAARSCMIITGDLIEDNNANAPSAGVTVPVGTGIQIAGGSYDTVTRSVANDPAPGICLFRAIGNQVYGNVFIYDGFFGNQTNSDLATETPSSYARRTCFYGNVDASGTLASAPAGIQAASVDGQPRTGPGTGNDVALDDRMICDTGFEPCPLRPSKARYPKQTRVVMLPCPGSRACRIPAPAFRGTRFAPDRLVRLEGVAEHDLVPGRPPTPSALRQRARGVNRYDR